MRALLLLILLSCEASEQDTAAPTVGSSYDWGLPDGVAPPTVPADNPMNEAKVALGRALFYEERLSLGGARPCGICHEQQKAFTDGFPRSVGATDLLHPHNSLPLVNVGYRPTLGWARTDLTSLEDQLMVPLLGEDPVEMGGDAAAIEAMINTDAEWVTSFADAFPDEGPWDLDHLAKAIAAFERTLISVDSPWDRYRRGDLNAVDDTTLRGADLFFGDAGCYRCHSGLNFNQPGEADGNATGPPGYHNLGLYNLDSAGAYPAGREGLLNETGQPADMGRFRTPTLRNLLWSEPYFHDGSAPTLSFVLEVLNEGGRHTEGGPYIGDGRDNPHKDPLIRPLGLTSKQLHELEQFLWALGEPAFVQAPEFSRPQRTDR